MKKGQLINITAFYSSLDYKIYLIARQVSDISETGVFLGDGYFLAAGRNNKWPKLYLSFRHIEILK